MSGLEPGQLWVMRVRAGALSLALLLLAGLAETLLREGLAVPLGALIAPALLLAGYFIFVAPPRRFRAWGYAIDSEELHVRHGVWTQVQTVVPLGRIEHIDISQGPLERAFGVCRLIVHTAGTLHSQVTVPGLSRDNAERMRDEIRARVRLEPE
jgi:membrane protein YdbS with pleckstrin-like domain